MKNKKTIILQEANDILTPIDINNLKTNIDKSSIIGLIETATGIVGTNKSDLMMAAGRIGQSIVKGETTKQLFIEIQDLREKGRIKDDYLKSKYGKKGFTDLLKLLEVENVDPNKWDAIKNIFYTSVSTSEEKERIRAYYLMQQCLNLKPYDFEVLKVCFDIANTPNHEYQNINHAGAWVSIVSDKLYGLPHFVEKSDERLVEQGLLTSRTQGDKSGVIPSQNFRLTDLGISLCNLIYKDN